MKLTNRGWFVLGFVAALALIGLTWAIGNIHWVGNGYCWGSFNECYPL